MVHALPGGILLPGNPISVSERFYVYSHIASAYSSLLDAARSNGRRSHGPRTAAGKHNSRMNGVKHGERSDPENHCEVMLALGEDPARFEALKQELSESFGSATPSLRNRSTTWPVSTGGATALSAPRPA